MRTLRNQGRPFRPRHGGSAAMTVVFLVLVFAGLALAITVFRDRIDRSVETAVEQVGRTAPAPFIPGSR